MITKTFTGEKKSVEQAVDAYFERYPYAGYGTRIVEQYEFADGTLQVTVRRAGTCD